MARNAVRPYDEAFRDVRDAAGIPRLTTDDCLRILEANKFRNPQFERRRSGYRVCYVTGPDGKKYDACQVLEALVKIERLERLCQDRSDAVVGLLNRKEKWSVWRGPE